MVEMEITEMRFVLTEMGLGLEHMRARSRPLWATTQGLEIVVSIGEIGI